MKAAEQKKVNQFLEAEDWKEVHQIELPGRQKQVQGYACLHLSEPGNNFLDACHPKGIYGHQKKALKSYLAGNNVCMTTGTSSGKSLVFQVAALEELAKDSQARVIAIYPLKALGVEQAQRWEKALADSGVNASVGRIDGQVPMGERLSILRNSRVLVMTPDIIHAWMLSNLHQRAIVDFLHKTSLIIVDELHSYSGVFGSNAAFLFRRIQHLMALGHKESRYICASATVANPERHLNDLLGRDFKIIGHESDTSPRHSTTVNMISPPGNSDLLTEVSQLLHFLATRTEARFIAFVDSRKQTEHLTSILARNNEKETAEGESEEHRKLASSLEDLNVLPYRAGYEEHDRKAIQQRLIDGTLAGVVSTSALELGIDIPHLDCGVLLGVPHSATSLHQRIGRVGRHCPGKVMVINTGDVYDAAVFQEPETLMNRPLAESTLYLENPRIQYIHALCLARPGGEHDKTRACYKMPNRDEFSSSIGWPQGFVKLCELERLGQVPSDLQAMKMESGDDPNHTFPLRDVESQFKVICKGYGGQRPLGSLSYAQLMREAYPGAVYYYATRPHRVYKVVMSSKEVYVRSEKRYTNRPQHMPTLVYPNMTEGNVFRSFQLGDLLVTECHLQVSESICGFKERRGPNEFSCNYPMDFAGTGVKWDKDRFTRNYFTTGVIISHPALDRDASTCGLIGQLLFDSFKMVVPSEFGDLGVACDKYRFSRGPFEEGRRFVAIFDQTYGSLRLSGRILEDEKLEKTLECMQQIEAGLDPSDCSADLSKAIDLLAACNTEQRRAVALDDSNPAIDSESELVIMPGSKGLYANRNLEEFQVEGVFFSPKENRIQYRGSLAAARHTSGAMVIPADSLKEIPGVSQMGVYDFETGTIEPVQEMLALTVA